MTAQEVVELVVQDLENIRVPVALFDQISIPIFRSINNLKALLEVWNNLDQKKPKEEQPNENA